MKKERYNNRCNIKGIILLSGLFFLIFFSACETVKTPYIYEPYEDLLAVIADLQIYYQADTYRFPAPKDVSGQNIFKASLVRIANFNKSNPGEFTEESEFASARCWLMLGKYENSASAYKKCIEQKGTLAEIAKKELVEVEKLRAIIKTPDDIKTLNEAVSEYKNTISKIKQFVSENKGSIVQNRGLIESENMYVEIIEIMKNNRWLLNEPVKTLTAEYEKLLSENKESGRYYEHVISFADFYYGLAMEYSRVTPPEAGDFEIRIFRNYVMKATDLYLEAETADGYDERRLGEKQLDALIEFSGIVEKKAK